MNSTRIKYRLDLTTIVATTTPIIKAVKIDAFAVVPIKYQYRVPIFLSERPAEDRNLQLEEINSLGFNDAAETALAKLDSWAENATVLTTTSRWSLYHNKKVILSAVAHRPVSIWEEGQVEKHVLQLEMNGL